MTQNALQVDVDSRAVATVTLQRAAKHNAFDAVLIAELTTHFLAFSEQTHLRAVVLRGDGPSFCAGADLAWMRRMKDYSLEENLSDSRALAGMFAVIDQCPHPVLCRVQGAALGGGAGLAAVSDLVVAADTAIFGFTEVKLGLIPAVISPYVLRKIGESHARDLFLTGRRFSAQEALRMGLAHRVAPVAQLDDALEASLQELLSAAPEAVRAAKALLRAQVPAVVHEPMVQAIAQRRVSAEAQERLGEFLSRSGA